MLVNTKDLLREAKRSHCAIPAINVFNLAGIKAAISASEEAKCPVIIAVAEVHLESLDIEEAAHIIKYYAEKSSQKVALHFDHGFNPDYVKRAIDAGFTSVMIDGSSLSYEDNVAICRKIVQYAHERNVCVEAEIGHVGGGESYIDADKDLSQLTTVEEAISFAKDTGIDSLAVSIGTAHGAYTGQPRLDFDRLKAIAENVDIPLVLHGGSGTGDVNLNRSVSLGITKVNLFTDTAIAAIKEIDGGVDFYKNYGLSINGIKKCIMRYFEIFETKNGDFNG